MSFSRVGPNQTIERGQFRVAKSNSFPLTRALPSIPSATVGCPVLFRDFAGTTALYDCLCSCVVCQITSWDLLTRSARHLADKHRLSRFSRRLFLYMLRFFDRAGFGCPSRFRGLRYGLPLSPTVSAPWSSLSRLDGWPVMRCSFVNASRLASRPTAHNSRSVWFVRPLPYDSFIHNNLPA